MSVLSIVKGFDADRKLQVRDATGLAFAPTTNPCPFDGTESLSATLWPGGSLASLFSPTVTWVDYTTATYQVSFTAASTAALSPGTYRLQVTAARGGKTGVIGNLSVTVTAAPGSDTPPLTFTTINDLLLYCPWITDLLDDGEESLFYAEQARATNHLVDVLSMAYKQQPMRLISPVGGSGTYLPYWGSIDQPSLWFYQQLVPLVPSSTPPANMIYRTSTPANWIRPTISTALQLKDEVVEICAKWAIAYVLKSQIGRNTEKEWQGLAANFLNDARSLFLSRRFEFDMSNPQTGWAWVTIDGGVSNVR